MIPEILKLDVGRRTIAMCA